MLASVIVFGVLHSFFRGGQEGSTVGSLHGAVGFHHALGDVSVPPELNAVCAIGGVPHRVIEVIVGEQRPGDRDLRDLVVCVELKMRTRGRPEAFQDEAGIFAEEKTAVADGCKTLGSVRDGSVDAVFHFVDGGVAGIYDGRLIHASPTGKRRRKRRKRDGPSEGIKSRQACGIENELPARERSDRFHSEVSKDENLRGARLSVVRN